MNGNNHKFENLTNDELENKIRERLGIFQTIVDFVSDVCLKIGKVIKREQGSCNTHIIYEITDFAGFYIYWSTGETQFGGATIKIRSINLSTTVVDFRYLGTNELGLEDIWEVNAFEEKLLRDALLEVIARKDKIIEMINEEKKVKESDVKQDRENRKERKELIDIANKLGL